MKTLMRYVWPLGLAALVAVASSAQSDAADAHRASDTNGDGVVDRREFNVRMVDVFYHLDRDKNGRLSRAEVPEAADAAFAAADANGDGQLQMQEFLHARSRDFERADADGDGSLSPPEAANAP